MFNILTRTNNRPKYFFLCHESIKSQDFKGDVNHYVSIDDPKKMEYIDMYRNTLKIVNVERKQKMQSNSFPYNDYLNTMLSKVQERCAEEEMAFWRHSYAGIESSQSA